MKMIIKVTPPENDKKEEMDITFSNEGINNENYVEMIIDKKDYLVPVEDLALVAKVFEEIRCSEK